MRSVRTAMLAAVAAAAVSAAVSTATAWPAPADPFGPIEPNQPDEPFVTCHQSVQGGADTDTCVGNPHAAGGSSDDQRVRVGFCFGLGVPVGDCGD